MGHQVMVEFVMKKKLGEGESLVVVGNIPQLGKWVPSSGLTMLLDSYYPDSWSANVNLPSGLAFEYKIVHITGDSNSLSWMLGSNRALLVPLFATMISIINMWEFVAVSIPVTITFGIKKQLDMGHQLLLSGDSKELGQWKLHRAHTMVWHVGYRWKTDINVAAGSIINYKYVRTSDQAKEVEWMPGPNRVLHVPKGCLSFAVQNNWTTDPVPSVCTPLLTQVQTVAVYFVLAHRCSFGHLFKLVGNIQKLGNWDPHKAVKMVWHFNDIWLAAINVHAGSLLEYKMALVREADDAVLQWQTGLNKKLAIPNTDHELVIEEMWQK